MTKPIETIATDAPSDLNEREMELWGQAYCSALPRGSQHQPSTNGSAWEIQNAIRAADVAVVAIRQRRPVLSSDKSESVHRIAREIGVSRDLLARIALEAKVDERSVCKELQAIRLSKTGVIGKAGDRLRETLHRRGLSSRAAIDALRDMVG